MPISTGNFDSIFFSWSYALFELRNLAKMKDIVSATPLKLLNRVSCICFSSFILKYFCIYLQYKHTCAVQVRGVFIVALYNLF